MPSGQDEPIEDGSRSNAIGGEDAPTVGSAEHRLVEQRISAGERGIVSAKDGDTVSEREAIVVGPAADADHVARSGGGEGGADRSVVVGNAEEIGAGSDRQ